MANLKVKDGDGIEKFIAKNGTGTNDDPFVDPSAEAISLNKNGQIDAFGRLRVSQVSTLFDSKFLHDKQTLFWDEETSGGAETSTHSTLTADITMTTSNAGEYVVRQTFQRFNYQSGKSQQIFMTFSQFENQSNITKRVGYFSSATTGSFDSDFDGIFIENNGTEVSIKVYRTGIEVFNVAQSDWDDPMDGTGESSQTIDWSLSQILMIDFEWLGVGVVRFSLVVDGVIYPFHTTKNANVKQLVYMSTPNQPLRYEIRQTGVGSGAMRQICSTVGSEGSMNEVGKILGQNMGVSFINANSTSVTYALMGIRLNSSEVDSAVDILSVTAIALTTDSFLYKIILNPTVAGTFTYNDVTNSSVQIATGDTASNPSTTTVTGGTLLSSGYIKSEDGGIGNLNASIVSAIRLGMSIGGTLDEIVFCVQPITTNLDILGSIEWRERT